MQEMDREIYDKKILYLDYTERGEKIKNGGAVKWEVRGEKCRLQFHIRGLYATDTLEGEIRILSGGQAYPAEHIRIRYGTGEAILFWDSQNLAGSGISYAECEGLEIRISDTRKLVGRIREYRVKPPLTEEIREIKDGEKAEDKPAENLKAVSEAEPSEPVSGAETATKTDDAAPETKAHEPAKGEKAWKGAAPEPIPALSANKWEQLNRIYKRIHPFGDERDYLCITPRDFVILQSKYQELVQNSFLLHGYYNYGHVILTKMQGEEEKFYIGVPGVYFEKEKQAALLFGFEGFEGGTETLQDGSFGYYMKRVDI